MKKYLFFLLIIFSVSFKSIAQEMTTDYLLSLQLPPLDSLYANARNSAIIDFYEYKLEGQKLLLKTDKKSWLSFFSLQGTYQYGVIGLNSYTNLGSNYPLIYQNSGGEQLWYNIGGALVIPFDKLFERRNKIKIQQTKIKETEKEIEMMFNEHKVKIIVQYYTVLRIMKELKLTDEAAVVANAQYALNESEFILGKITAQGLSTAKGIQVQAITQLENAKAELRIALLTLEVLSNTKIIQN